MKPTITVFTPTFNRAYTLFRCYESLKRQTSRDFIWLIIDDGSTDDTKELVGRWIAEGIIPIRYHYQDNQGMHGAHNTAYRLIETELNVCIDSDDFMTDDAVEKIVLFWQQNGADRYAGIIALNADKGGNVIGTKLPRNKTEITLTGFYSSGGRGDKKLIYRTAVMRKYPPYPVFAGEKYVSLSYKYILADQEYTMLIMNEAVCIVEYRADGSSLNMIDQYRKNPRGFAEFRKLSMQHSVNRLYIFRQCIHYVSSSIMLRNAKFIRESPCRIMTILAIPFGLLLYLYIAKIAGKWTAVQAGRKGAIS
ncbi:MAG: glycosyltransferase family 2 protein [Anaerolineaceae bacterium]|nr:glycosyltransferase family 2 protein [Anaerolineaceae bacterium]